MKLSFDITAKAAIDYQSFYPDFEYYPIISFKINNDSGLIYTYLHFNNLTMEDYIRNNIKLSVGESKRLIGIIETVDDSLDNFNYKVVDCEAVYEI